ncbi:MAG: HEAT repeat domain-containing protein [Isosphaeraceae bacterium]|nr:HEAT repeat domain-containing protein [Isosphaeraceae bacterium]
MGIALGIRNNTADGAMAPGRVARFVALVVLLAPASIGRAEKPPKAPAEVHSPQAPEAARAAMRVDPGLTIELVAAEPEVQSPVAMAFDEEGRLWVVEMPDYPNGPPPGSKPEGRIKVLEDRDEDGRFEHAAVFADGLLFANGLLPWKGGAIVTAAPQILWLSDTDGDGRADRRDVLYEGFTAGNPQLRVNHPILGLDGWVYVANGLRGGKVRRAGRPDAEIIDLSGRDFRFDLIHDRAEAIAGMGQYGNTFDDWGHRFVCTNRNHLIPIVLEDRYLKRNPYLSAPSPNSDNQGPGGAARIYPLSRNWTTSSLHVGTFTAACGVTIYRGDLLPESYRGCAFTCDPTGNLVHQEVLIPSGASFRWHPAREGVEFLASPDDWFRPVSLAHGPDGAFYVVDMYRAVIEHPEFMPPELKERPDLTLGKDRGRLWRIVPEGRRAPSPRPHLGRATTPELVALLAHPNAWWRTAAQRLLVERQDPAARELLRKLVESSESPLARLHAAWLLESFGALDEHLILKLLAHDHPRLREQAVLLAERRLAQAPPIRERVQALAGDADPRVRFQVALSLGAWDDDRILDPLARIALAGAEDRWTRLAVATAVPERAGALIRTLLRPEHGLASRVDEGRLALLRELAALVGARRDPDEVTGVLEALWSLDEREAIRWQIAGLGGLADGMGRRGQQLGAFLAERSKAGAVAGRATALLGAAAQVAEDQSHEPAERVDAIRLLAHAPWEVAEPPLMRLVTDDPSQEVRIAAVRALAAHGRPEVAERLLTPWKVYTPAVRREAAQALLARPERIAALLRAIEAGRIAPGDLDALQARRLVEHRQPEIRNRARKLLRESMPQERREVLERYRAALDLKGDPLRGKEVFRKNCATCHRVAGLGVDVGPDIGDTRTKTKEMLLGDILNPNAAIDGNYVSYTVATKDGRVLSGLIAEESASGLTLRRAEGQTDVLLRQDIEEIRSSGISLMPEGLEKEITIEQMADLLAFLKDWRYLDGTVPRRSGD